MARKTFTAGSVFTAADANTYFMNQVLRTYASAAARDAAETAPAENYATALADVNTLTIYSGSAWSTIGPVHGALTTWTPAVTQSVGVTLTNNGSFYHRVGRLITATFIVTVTGAGTASNDIVITLPVNSSYPSSHPMFLGGNVEVYDLSVTTPYSGIPVLSAASAFKVRAPTAPTRVYLGSSNMTAALASGDVLSGTVTFEAAADA